MWKKKIQKIQQLPCQVDAYVYSFFPQGIELWNALPQHLIDSPDLSTFREGLS